MKMSRKMVTKVKTFPKIVFLMTAATLFSLLPTSVKGQQCTFSIDAANFTDAVSINKLCRRRFADEIVHLVGRKGVFLHDRRCGRQRNAGEDEVCFSDHAESKLGSSFLHKIRLPQEPFYPDYVDPSKKRFKRKREIVEDALNVLLLSSSELLASGFERATVLSIEDASSSEEENNRAAGIEIEALVQFNEDGVSSDEYSRIWEELTSNGRMSENVKVDKSGDYLETIKDEIPKCDSWSSYVPEIPEDVLEATREAGTDPTQLTPIGGTVDLKCPAGLRFSPQDEDDFNDADNVIAIICTSVQRFRGPRSEWPRCLRPCDASSLPSPPEWSGLRLKGSQGGEIPAGKFGEYECIGDGDVGVDRGVSGVYEVLCENGTFNLPLQLDDWPRCGPRTSTFSPVIPFAAKKMLRSSDSNLRYRSKRSQWDLEDDVGTLDFTPVEDWLYKVTIPATIGLILAVISCCCIFSNGSPCYKICADPNVKKKVKKEIKEITA